MAAFELRFNFRHAHCALDLHRQRHDSIEPGRSVSMGLVKAPCAVVLQQAAGNRAHSIRRHLHFWRHGIRRPVFLAAVRRDFEFDAVAFLAREIGARTAFWLLLIATATPLLGIGSILMTIDPPLVLCWTWAMVAGWRAAQPDGKTRDWLVTGLAMGLAFLCKYSALYQIICFGIFFALWPARANPFAKIRSVARAADFCDLHAARRHLEFATQLDHRPPCRGQRRTSRQMASDTALLSRFYFSGIRRCSIRFFSSAQFGR